MNKLKLIFISILTFLAFNSFAQIEKVQALFVYNFSRYILWPENTNNTEFIIGVIGDKTLFQEISRISKDKMVGRQKINVLYFQAVEEITATQIMVVAGKFNKNIAEIKAALSSSPALIVTERDGMVAKGSDIGFRLDDDKMKFLMSRKSIKDKGLNIDSRLSDMAILVD